MPRCSVSASIRVAHSDDASRVSELCRRAIPDDVRPATPAGSCYGDAWIRHRLSLADDAANNRPSLAGTNGKAEVEQPPVYRVADHAGQIAGVAEWRAMDAHLFLNTIATDPRGCGIGTLLLRDGLERWPSLELVELDVFASMPNAIRWYERLGFEAKRKSRWVFYPPPVLANSRRGVHRSAAVSRDADEERVQWTNCAEATAEHGEYGISMLNLKVDGDTYRVGRLGSDFFRVTDPETFQNPVIRDFLDRLDSSRHLVYRATSPPERDPFTGLKGRDVDTSTRMRASRTTILQAMTPDVPRP